MRQSSIRATIALAGLVMLACVATDANAQTAPTPVLVIRDTLALGLEVSVITVDSSDTTELVLLVGTGVDSTGRAHLLHVGVAPLRVIDTVASFDHVPHLIRSGDIGLDGTRDYLVGLRNPESESFFAGLVALYGPNNDQKDTLTFPNYLEDAAIDSRGHIWIAYAENSVDTIFPDSNWEAELRTFSGSTQRRTSMTRLPFEFDDRKAGLFFTEIDSPNETEPQMLVAFLYKYDVSAFYPEGGSACRRVLGTMSIALADFTQTYRTLYSAGIGDRQCEGSGIVPTYPWYYGDFSGSGENEVLVNVRLKSFHQNFAYASVLNATTGKSLWSRRDWIGRKQESLILWDLNDDQKLDIVWKSSNWEYLLGLNAATGETIFTISAPQNFSPEFSCDFGGITGRRGIMVSSDSIFLFDFNLHPSSVGELIPKRFALHPNYPNPFNASTQITYALPEPATVRLTIYDVLGRHVSTLVSASQTAGAYSTTWNGTDDQGHDVSSGVYFYRLTVSDEVTARKMLLLK